MILQFWFQRIELFKITLIFNHLHIGLLQSSFHLKMKDNKDNNGQANQQLTQPLSSTIIIRTPSVALCRRPTNFFVKRPREVSYLVFSEGEPSFGTEIK